MEVKYIRHTSLGFVLWPCCYEVTHADMAAFIEKNVRLGEVASAGFATVEGGVARCYGRSESLNLSSDVHDSTALARHLGLAVRAPAQA